MNSRIVEKTAAALANLQNSDYICNKEGTNMETLFGILFWCAVICLVARWYDRRARRNLWKSKKKQSCKSKDDDFWDYAWS